MSISFIFDLETTGFKRNSKILEIAWIKYDSYLGKIISIGHQYFNAYEVPASSTEVHGLTAESLQQLSGGVWFEEYADALLAELEDVDIIVSHNLIGYDYPVLLNNLASCGKKLPDRFLARDPKLLQHNRHLYCTYKHAIELMKPHTTAGHKQATLYQYVATSILGRTVGEIDAMYSTLTGCVIQSHTAVYDSFMCYIVYRYLLTL